MFENYRRRRKNESVRLIEVEISFLGLKGKWIADVDQQKAAWELYVELITRVATQPLPTDSGLLREALSSLYALFPETRRILKQYGPGVAVPHRKGDLSFAGIAVRVLNQVLRPLLAFWHPVLEAYESQRPASVSPVDYERSWKHYDELRQKIDETRLALTRFSNLLAAAAGIDVLDI